MKEAIFIKGFDASVHNPLSHCMVIGIGCGTGKTPLTDYEMRFGGPDDYITINKDNAVTIVGDPEKIVEAMHDLETLLMHIHKINKLTHIGTSSEFLTRLRAAAPASENYIVIDKTTNKDVYVCGIKFSENHGQPLTSGVA